MASAEAVSASLENYLEAIFHISEDKQAARAKDIAQRLKLKGSSVTGALRLLSERGLINYAPYDIITLTPKGKKVARDVVNNVHAEELRRLGVNRKHRVLLKRARSDEKGPSRPCQW